MLQFDKINKYFGSFNNLWKMKKVNSIMKLSINSSFVILIFAILNYRLFYISSFQILTPTHFHKIKIYHIE